MFSMEKFCQVNFARIYFFLMKDISTGQWRMWTHGARVMKQSERSNETYMGEEVCAEVEAELVEDASENGTYRMRFGLHALLYLLSRADVSMGTRELEKHASVLRWVEE
jgi:hypothetical protein